MKNAIQPAAKIKGRWTRHYLRNTNAKLVKAYTTVTVLIAFRHMNATIKELAAEAFRLWTDDMHRLDWYNTVTDKGGRK